MFCPKCKAEYREGFEECKECNTPLVDVLPQELANQQDYIKFVTAYKTSNPGLIAFAKSILEAEGIEYFIKGEGVQDLFGLGRLGTGYSPLVGVAEIQVDEYELERAKGLLKEMEERNNYEIEDDIDPPEKEILDKDTFDGYEIKNSGGFLKGLFVVVLITAAVFLFLIWRH